MTIGWPRSTSRIRWPGNLCRSYAQISTQVRDQREHGDLVEAAAAKGDLFPRQELQLVPRFRGGRVDPRLREALHVNVVLVRVDDVHRFLAAGDAVGDERTEDAVALLRGMEERGDVALLPHHGAGQRDGH